MSIQYYKLKSNDLLNYLRKKYGTKKGKGGYKWEEIWELNTESKKYRLLYMKKIYTDCVKVVRYKTYEIDAFTVPYYNVRLKCLKPITEAELFVEVLCNEDVEQIE